MSDVLVARSDDINFDLQFFQKTAHLHTLMDFIVTNLINDEK